MLTKSSPFKSPGHPPSSCSGPRMYPLQSLSTPVRVAGAPEVHRGIEVVAIRTGLHRRTGRGRAGFEHHVADHTVPIEVEVEGHRHPILIDGLVAVVVHPVAGVFESGPDPGIVVIAIAGHMGITRPGVAAEDHPGVHAVPVSIGVGVMGGIVGDVHEDPVCMHHTTAFHGQGHPPHVLPIKPGKAEGPLSRTGQTVHRCPVHAVRQMDGQRTPTQPSISICKVSVSEGHTAENVGRGHELGAEEEEAVLVGLDDGAQSK